MTPNDYILRPLAADLDEQHAAYTVSLENIWLLPLFFAVGTKTRMTE